MAESGGKVVRSPRQQSYSPRGFRSVADLQASIEAFLNVWNMDPKPFVWTATVESIQEKLTRCRQTLEIIQPGCTTPKSRKRSPNSA